MLIVTMGKNIDHWFSILFTSILIFSYGTCGQFSWFGVQNPSPSSPDPQPLVESDSKILTRLNGCPVSDKYNILTVGPRGPLLGEDGEFIEDMTHFTHERIPERVVHANGYGASGIFTPTNTKVLSHYTKAPLFTVPDVITKVAVRFSLTIGSKGSSDSARDNRGFAIKFYTNTGNFDLLTLSFPVFPVRDPFRFIYFIHAFKPDPVGNWPVLENTFSFLVANPEVIHSFMYIYSDAGTPDGFRHIPGYSVNTFRLTNLTGSTFYARFKLIPDSGIKNLTRHQSTQISGIDPSYSAKDLYNSIKLGKYPSWTLRVQIIEPNQLADIPFNIFDPTKIWWERNYPSIEIGRLTLNRNPENEFAEIEQLAFKPSNLIPGINVSPDKILQGRVLAYIDAQNYRLGANNYKLPVNAPIHPIVDPTVRDGAYVCGSNGGSTPNFLPNLYSPQFKLASKFYADPEENLFGPCISARYNSLQEDNFSQPGQLWEILTPQDQDALVANMGSDLLQVPANLQVQVIKTISQANTDFAERLATFLTTNKPKV